MSAYSYKKLESGEHICDDCNKHFMKQMNSRRCNHKSCDLCILKNCTNCLYPNILLKENSEKSLFNEANFNRMQLQMLGKTQFLVFMLKTTLPFSTIEDEALFKQYMRQANLFGNLLILSYQNNEWIRSKIPDSNTMLNPGVEYYLCRARYPSKKYIEDILDGPTKDCTCTLV